MQRKNTNGCKCCCSAPCITIDGYYTVSPWVQVDPPMDDECATCCWTRDFFISEDEVEETCTNVCNNGTNSRYIVYRRTAAAGRIRVYYSQTQCECDPEPVGGKWFISIRVIDSVQYVVWWNYGGLFGPVPTCDIPCPPVECNQFDCPGCEWYSLGQCPEDTVTWYRTKIFTSKPSGDITFGDEDILECLYDSYPDNYLIPCHAEPQVHTTEEQCVTTDLIACVNARLSANGFFFQCTGTSNATTCFSAPTVTINAC
jgi:hypothetical protein